MQHQANVVTSGQRTPPRLGRQQHPKWQRPRAARCGWLAGWLAEQQYRIPSFGHASLLWTTQWPIHMTLQPGTVWSLCRLVSALRIQLSNRGTDWSAELNAMVGMGTSTIYFPPIVDSHVASARYYLGQQGQVQPKQHMLDRPHAGWHARVVVCVQPAGTGARRSTATSVWRRRLF